MTSSRALVYAAGAAIAAGVSLTGALARPAGEQAAAVDGAALFVQKGCAACHAGPGRSSASGVGPSLVDAASWAGERIEGIGAGDYLAASMTQPAAFISPAWAGPNGPSNGMPLLQLSDDEVAALVDYLLAAPPGTTG